MRNIWAIVKKELYIYFVSPIGYVVITIFLVLCGYFFYTNTLYFNLFTMGGGISLTEGVWQFVFSDMRFVLFLTIPLLTMRLFAEEKKVGTIELLLTSPVKDVELVIGKFIAPLFVFAIMLILTFLYPALLSTVWGGTEIFPLLSGYVGIFLLGSAFISYGILVSSLTENQIIAAMGTFGFFVIMWFMMWNEAVSEPWLTNILLRISLLDRTYNFFRGIIDTKDVVFFLVITVFFLFLTYCSLDSRRWRR